MRKGASLFIILTMALMLGACAQPPIPSDSGVSVIEYPDGTKEVNYGPGQYGNEELQANYEGCREWAEVEQARKYEQMSTIPVSHKSFVLMHEETMAMVREVFGKGNDPCKAGTNQWDAYIAYVEQHNATIRSITKDAVDLGKTGIITHGVVTVVDGIVGKVGDTVEGDQIKAGNNANKAGGDVNQNGAVMPMTRTDSTTENTLTQTQVGSDESIIESSEVSSTNFPGEALAEEPEEEGAEESAEATETAETAEATTEAE